MRNSHYVVVFSGLVLGGLSAFCGEAQEPERVVLAVDVTDGSLLIAHSTLRQLAFKTSVGNIDLPLRETKSIARRNDGETFTIKLRNGDVLTGAMRVDIIELNTIFGKVALTENMVKAIRVLPEKRTVILQPASDGKDAQGEHDGAAKDGVNFGDAKELRVRGNYNGKAMKFWLEFDLKSISCRPVQSAILYLHASGSDTDCSASAWKLLAECWDENTITFATGNALRRIGPAHRFQNVPSGWTAIDLTEAVQQWVSGAKENCGIIIEHADEINQPDAFSWWSSDADEAAKRPKLEIVLGQEP